MIIFSDRAPRDITDSLGDINNENNCENANTRKKDIVLKKPQASLLRTYSQTWKQAHNHFMRYSDVKERDDRRPSVMDLANQPKVSQRVHGWKTHLISAEIIEMVISSEYNRSFKWVITIFTCAAVRLMPRLMKWKS